MPYPQRQWRRLAIVVGTVLLVHGVVLQRSPTAWQVGSDGDSPSSEIAFTTRTVAFGQTTSAQVTSPPSTSRVASTAPATISAPNSTAVTPASPTSTPEAVAPPAPTESTAQAVPPEDLAVATPQPPVDEPPASTQAMSSQVNNQRFLYPGSVQLNYDVKANINGLPITANGELRWVQDGKYYEARLKWGNILISRTLSSKGELSAQGLEPARFGDKTRSELAAHFVREKGQVIFSANTPDLPIEPGAQDRASVFIQLAAMFGGEPERFPAGSSFAFQTVDARAAETWKFKVEAQEPINLPSGKFNAIKLVREPVGDYSQKVEVWLAPSMSYLPVHIRITEGNGNVLDQIWRSSENP